MEEHLDKMDVLLTKWMRQWHDNYIAANPDCTEEDAMRAFLHSLHYGLTQYPMMRGIDVKMPQMSKKDIETIHSIR